MANNGRTYSRVFNQMCHMVALKRDGKLNAAIDSLVLTTLVLDQGTNAESPHVVKNAIGNLFGVQLREDEIQASIERHVSFGHLHKSGDLLSLSPQTRAEVEERIENVRGLEEAVKTGWISAIAPHFETAPDNWQEQIWNCLRTYMAKTFHQHGARTIQLLEPKVTLSAEDSKSLISFMEDAHKEHCPGIPLELAKQAVQLFFQQSDSKRTRYVVQLLDGTFTFFALTVDEEISRYLRDNVPNVSIFMDSNFIFGVLGLHDNRMNEVSKELVEIIKTNNFPFKLYYHVATLEEMQRTLAYYGDKIRGKTWQPEISRRATNLPEISGIERKYHERNAERPTNPDIFLSRFEHLSNLLDSEFGFIIYRPSHMKADQQQRYDIMHDYEGYLSGRYREKSYEVRDHDVLIWQTVREIRKPGQTGLDAGAFFLTVDYLFYSFDRDKLRKDGEISTTILPNQLLQLLRPFVSLSEEIESRFVETFSIPEFRAVDVDYRDTYSKVLSYMNAYLDISEKTALKILTNEMAMRQFENLDEDTEEFKRVFESLLAEQNVALADEIQNLESEYAQKAKELQQLNDNLSSKDSRIQQVEADLLKLRNQIDLLASSKDQQERTYEERITKERQDAEMRLNEEREKSKQRDAEREKQLTEAEKQRLDLENRLEREQIRNRMIVAFLMIPVGIAAIWIVPNLVNWQWLLSHPNQELLKLMYSFVVITFVLRLTLAPKWRWFAEHPRKLGLQISAIVILAGVAMALAHPQNSETWIIGVFIGAIFTIAQIVDRK